MRSAVGGPRRCGGQAGGGHGRAVARQGGGHRVGTEQGKKGQAKRGMHKELYAQDAQGMHKKTCK